MYFPRKEEGFDILNAESGKVYLVLHVPFFQNCHDVVNHPL